MSSMQIGPSGFSTSFSPGGQFGLGSNWFVLWKKSRKKIIIFFKKGNWLEKISFNYIPTHFSDSKFEFWRIHQIVTRISNSECTYFLNILDQKIVCFLFQLLKLRKIRWKNWWNYLMMTICIIFDLSVGSTETKN